MKLIASLWKVYFAISLLLLVVYLARIMFSRRKVNVELSIIALWPLAVLTKDGRQKITKYFK